MDTFLLPELNQLYVFVGERAAIGRLLDMAAQLAPRGPLLLDCSNRAKPSPLVRELHRLTHDPVMGLRTIQTARAFTCYQVVALLENAARRPLQHPVLIFDLLASFYDESVSYGEGRRLLQRTLRCVTYIHRFAPVVISARPPFADFPERKSFLKMLNKLSDILWVEEAPQDPHSKQLSFLP